ncbi:MAG: hypothetical protein KBT27_11020 [Prevotellaceae bacterium]|nr:hypothetical protein [Candidatus Faecinaster equi]
MTVKGFFKGVWQFVSFLAVPQWGKHITEHAQSYAIDDQTIQVAKLLEKQNLDGNQEPLTPEIVPQTLRKSLPEATAAHEYVEIHPQQN